VSASAAIEPVSGPCARLAVAQSAPSPSRVRPPARDKRCSAHASNSAHASADGTPLGTAEASTRAQHADASRRSSASRERRDDRRRHRRRGRARRTARSTRSRPPARSRRASTAPTLRRFDILHDLPRRDPTRATVARQWNTSFSAVRSLREAIQQRRAGSRDCWPSSSCEHGPGEDTCLLRSSRTRLMQLRMIYRVPFEQALELLDAWLKWARRCQLAPFVKLAKTITKQRPGIEAALRHGLSNARTEQVNTQIRLITRRGFGYHSPWAVIALAMLSLGGLCAPLPGRRHHPRFLQEVRKRGVKRDRGVSSERELHRAGRSREASSRKGQAGAARLGAAARPLQCTGLLSAASQRSAVPCARTARVPEPTHLPTGQCGDDHASS